MRYRKKGYKKTRGFKRRRFKKSYTKKSRFSKKRFGHSKRFGKRTRRISSRGIVVPVSFTAIVGPPPVTAWQTSPYQLYSSAPIITQFSFSIGNLGYTNASTQEGYFNKALLTSYFFRYRRYQINRVKVTATSLYPDPKYNQIRLPTGASASLSYVNSQFAQQTGSWVLRSDPACICFQSIENLYDWKDLKGCKYTDGTRPVHITCKPRWQQAAFTSYLTPSSTGSQLGQAQMSLSTSTSSRKPLQTFTYNDITSLTSTTNSPGLNTTNWSGLCVGYIPPKDPDGLDYGDTGYSPYIYNPTAIALKLHFKVYFKFFDRQTQFNDVYSDTSKTLYQKTLPLGDA